MNWARATVFGCRSSTASEFSWRPCFWLAYFSVLICAFCVVRFLLCREAPRGSSVLRSLAWLDLSRRGSGYHSCVSSAQRRLVRLIQFSLKIFPFTCWSCPFTTTPSTSLLPFSASQSCFG